MGKVLIEDERLGNLTRWTAAQLASMQVSVDPDSFRLTPVSGDASFRRYFRASLDGRCWIAVDAPPETEDSGAFVAIAEAWLKSGISVPRVYQADLEHGFMLIEDFGNRLFLPLLQAEGGQNDPGREDNADRLYGEAFSELVKIQQCTGVAGYALPHYSRTLLLNELRICPEWFLQQQLAIELTGRDQALLEQVFELLIANALEQPQVCVHRDYHSRNLMWLEDGESGTGRIGVLDFQGAVIGPATYDAVSLLRDCYIDWPELQLGRWLAEYQQMAEAAQIIEPVAAARFRRWFDLMGLQRHLKCLGLFSRLNIRDGKPAYLRDIPRTYGYVSQVCSQYAELANFAAWLNHRVSPLLQAQGLIE